jgi:hypothetical protein
MKPGAMISAPFLAMVAVGHLLGLVLGVEVIVGGFVILPRVRVIGCVGPAGLAVGLWRKNREAER